MSQPENPMPKSPTSHLHVINLVVALLAGVISIAGGIYSLKSNIFSGPAYGSLQGIVRDVRIARPLKLTSVEVSDLTGVVVNTAATDDNGHYSIEALKTGNYVVKFTAPLHKIETKSIKIEKDLASSISVDLVPESQQIPAASLESPAVRTIAPPYAPATAYPAATPVAPSYNANGAMASGTTVPPAYVPSSVPTDVPQIPPDQQYPGYHRHHSRRSYAADSADSSSATSQDTSQSSVLTQAGAQLLQALVTKKSDSSSSTTTASN